MEPEESAVSEGPDALDVGTTEKKRHRPDEGDEQTSDNINEPKWKKTKLDDCKESINESYSQIGKDIKQNVTQQLSEYRVQEEQSISENKCEKREVSTEARSEAMEVMNEESEVPDKDCNVNDKPLERVVKEETNRQSKKLSLIHI